MKLWGRECDTCGKADEAWDDVPAEAPCAVAACLGTMRRVLGGRPSGFSSPAANPARPEYDLVGLLFKERPKTGGDA